MNRAATCVLPDRNSVADDAIVRNEVKYDLFRSDLPTIEKTIERDYPEIDRPQPVTLTLYFYSPERGAPDVDTSFRLRTYAHLDDPTAVTMGDIKKLTWRVEKKYGKTKERLGTIAGLPESAVGDGEAWDLAGAVRRPNLLKMTRRRHFALAEAHDELQRLTIDLSREVVKMGRQPRPLGDLGPRVEVKLPHDDESAVPITRRLRAAGHWKPFAGLTSYFQFLLHSLVPMRTHLALPEIEYKHMLSSNNIERTFGQLSGWLHDRQDKWRLLLPFPHSVARVRRYHVCRGLRPNTTTTVVETASGRCSLKTKEDARQSGSVLLRATQASHTTDLDGAVTTPDNFIQDRGLEKLNEFTKTQRKIPIALANGHSFQFSIDHCADTSGRRLRQIEIEYIGSLDGHIAPVDQVVEEIDYVGRRLLESPIGPALEPTHVSKHTFFASG
ncbi:hypothetical protein [Micromonospora sp. WMMD736]|uniref:hypothetical protein n=1 Tax=Micromonospora sp. WMMD736 TaxID=3404112 RepID=UPI003B95550D